MSADLKGGLGRCISLKTEQLTTLGLNSISIGRMQKDPQLQDCIVNLDRITCVQRRWDGGDIVHNSVPTKTTGGWRNASAGWGSARVCQVPRISDQITLAGAF